MLEFLKYALCVIAIIICFTAQSFILAVSAPASAIGVVYGLQSKPMPSFDFLFIFILTWLLTFQTAVTTQGDIVWGVYALLMAVIGFIVGLFAKRIST